MVRKKKYKEKIKDRNLDEFLTDLKIDSSKREQILEYMENLTFEQIKKSTLRKAK